MAARSSVDQGRDSLGWEGFVEEAQGELELKGGGREEGGRGRRERKEGGGRERGGGEEEGEEGGRGVISATIFFTYIHHVYTRPLVFTKGEEGRTETLKKHLSPILIQNT